MGKLKVIERKKRLAVTTSVLFDMAEADAVWLAEKKGELPPGSYRAYMIERIDEPLKPGPQYEFIRHFDEFDEHDLILMSHNSALTGIRAIRTLARDGITPANFVFTNGGDITEYLPVYEVDQFYSTNRADVEMADEMNIAAAHYDHIAPTEGLDFDALIKTTNVTRLHRGPVEVRGQHKPALARTARQQKFGKAARPLPFVFDFDCVIAGSSAEEVFQKQGLESYLQFEAAKLMDAMEEGPWFQEFKDMALHPPGKYLISIVTARGVASGMRFFNTLAHWAIEPNGEIHCMHGRDKTPILAILQKRFGPSTQFLDDGDKHVARAREAGIISGHVLANVRK